MPPAKKGCCWGTWLVFVLPYLEQQPLYNAWNSFGTNEPDMPAGYDLDLRYFGTANRTVTSTWINTYLCPSDQTNAPISVETGGTTLACTSQNYAVNFGNSIQLQVNFQDVHFGGAPFVDIGAPYMDNMQPGKLPSRFCQLERRAEHHAAGIRGGGGPGARPARVLLVGRRRGVQNFPWTQQFVSRYPVQPLLLLEQFTQSPVCGDNDRASRQLRGAAGTRVA